MPFAVNTSMVVDLASTLVSLTGAEGSASHAYTHSYELNADPLATRNIADVLHLLSMLHGTQPGLIELAAARNVDPSADLWFAMAAAGFAVEREYLTQLIVAAGPTPGTPGEAETAAAVLGQRHALEMIAQSDRFGCAIGASAALALDWQAIRAVLDTAAERMSIPIPVCILPDEPATAMLLGSLSDRPRLDRALTFGARQLLLQHYGLWELLDARQGARGAN